MEESSLGLARGIQAVWPAQIPLSSPKHNSSQESFSLNNPQENYLVQFTEKEKGNKRQLFGQL